VTRAVRTLAEHGLVVRRGVFCCVSRHLFRLWLEAVYRLQQSPVHVELPVAEQAFAEHVRRWLQQATARAPQQVLETAAEVIRRFQNDLVDLHGRRVRLPRMDVHTLLMPGVPRAVVGQRLRSEEAAPRPSGQGAPPCWWESTTCLMRRTIPASGRTASSRCPGGRTMRGCGLSSNGHGGV
ncbi:MAG: hypothetical protein HY600_06070, partial [Candidatus Omnitrophica bacterium]|nr:hypothetical protein [Candidatus Omnitrophota bacterium]